MTSFIGRISISILKEIHSFKASYLGIAKSETKSDVINCVKVKL